MNPHIEKFQKQQIERCAFIKNKANDRIINLESEIAKLKEQIKIEKAIIKEANTDIEHYSDL